MACGHDPKYGVMLLPKEAGGCLACHAEQQAERIKELERQLAAAQKLISPVTDNPAEDAFYAKAEESIEPHNSGPAAI